MNLLARLLALGALLALPSHVQSASLQASPILVEITDKSPSAVVTIRNTGDKPIQVQTRVMQWSQVRGQETLDEAEAVIASPPMTTLNPGVNYAVRIVRTARGAVRREEAYRVLVDQLPDPSNARGSIVALVMRHSIPVFLSGGQGGAARVEWELGARNGRLVLRANNHGSRRLRLAQVTVQLSDGRKVSFGNGLLGYVLAGSMMEWVSAAPAAARPGGSVTATTDLGPLSAQAHPLR